MRRTGPERTNVQVLRGIRDRLNRTFADMTADEVLAHFAARRPEKTKAKGRSTVARKRRMRAKAKV